MRRKDDILLKSAFEDMFPEFLRFFILNADTIFDIQRGFEFMDKELREIMPEIANPGGNRFVDMLVKVWLLTGNEEWILVHIEIQGQNDETFARRMFTYYYRVLDRYSLNISAYAIFTGDKNQKRHDHYENLFLGTAIKYTYNTYQIFDHTEAELLAMDNPFALVILAAQKTLLAGKIPEEELGEHRLAIAKVFIESRKYSHQQIQKFVLFLKNFIQVSNPGLNAIFDERIDSLTKQKVTMGIIETVYQIKFNEGQDLKAEKVIINLITDYGFNNEQAAKTAEVDIDFVKQVREKMQKQGSL